MGNQNNDTKNPVTGERVRKLWRNSSIIWMLSYYVVNIFAFSSSIFVILLECFVNNNKAIIIFLSALAAILTFVSFVINFRQQYSKYRKAFNVLNVAMLDYYAHPDESKKIDGIVGAISIGENIIDNTYDLETPSKAN